MFDLDDVQNRRAVRAAARTLGLRIVQRDGPARFAVQLADAEDAYRLGLETMKRWRAALGRDLGLEQRRGWRAQ
jgi:hypothetical protein